ncbi:hypothetical protein F5Y07DRAFT_153746 [Xylaria sp. FL0933]|nr:hypothetical protein F5Y07DRAFT_153746 [Xylaria sp. FL0933]
MKRDDALSAVPAVSGVPNRALSVGGLCGLWRHVLPPMAAVGCLSGQHSHCSNLDLRRTKAPKAPSLQKITAPENCPDRLYSSVHLLAPPLRHRAASKFHLIFVSQPLPSLSSTGGPAGGDEADGEHCLSGIAPATASSNLSRLPAFRGNKMYAICRSTATELEALPRGLLWGLTRMAADECQSVNHQAISISVPTRIGALRFALWRRRRRCVSLPPLSYSRLSSPSKDPSWEHGCTRLCPRDSISYTTLRYLLVGRISRLPGISWSPRGSSQSS